MLCFEWNESVLGLLDLLLILETLYVKSRNGNGTAYCPAPIRLYELPRY